MTRSIRVAAIQMDAMPAPKADRLERAEELVANAAQAGAQLVVLPELFNIGYAYSDDNFGLAEAIDGKTGVWIEMTAARYGIHLAGTFLLFENDEIYNSMLLFGPGGQMWRYDKSYPWAWERGYFREHRGTTVAKTELGDIGMMICWDLGHPELWKQYAGKVDMIMISSCPPDGPNASYQFSNGETLDFSDLGSMKNSMKNVGKLFFGEMVNQQAKWLGVPVVNSGASGKVQTVIPNPSSLFKAMMLFAPRSIRSLSQSSPLEMSCEMISSCKVVDSKGDILAARASAAAEGFVLAEVRLSDSKSIPAGRQPKPPLSPMQYQFSRLNADIMVPLMMRSVYKNGLKKIKK